MRLGFDYTLPADQTLTLAVQPRFNENSSDESLRSRQTDLTLGQPVYIGSTDRQNATTGRSRSADFTLPPPVARQPRPRAYGRRRVHAAAQR